MTDADVERAKLQRLEHFTQLSGESCRDLPIENDQKLRNAAQAIYSG